MSNTKFIYDLKSIDDIFNEQIMIETPKQSNYAELLRGMGEAQLLNLLINALNRYGEDGWQFISTITGTTGVVYLCFKKEVATTKVKE